MAWPACYRCQLGFDAAGDVAHAGDLCPAADRNMADDAGMRTHHDRIAKTSRTGDSTLSDNDAIAPNDDIVRDLDEVIDLRAVAHHRIRQRPSIDRRVGPDLDIAADDYASDLRYLGVTRQSQSEAEAILAYSHARMNNDFVADDRMYDRCAGADIAIFAEHNS